MDPHPLFTPSPSSEFDFYYDKVFDTMHPFLEKLGLNYKKLKKNLNPPSASAVSNFENLNWRCITYDYDNKENHSYHNCDNGK